MDGGGLCFSFIDWSVAKKAVPASRTIERELYVRLFGYELA